jgi:hypothetical protein
MTLIIFMVNCTAMKYTLQLHGAKSEVAATASRGSRAQLETKRKLSEEINTNAGLRTVLKHGVRNQKTEF